ELWDPRTQKGTTVAMSPNRGVRAAAPLGGGRVLFVFASGAAVWNAQTLAWEGVPEAVPGTKPLDCGDSARALTLASGRVLVISRFFRGGRGGLGLALGSRDWRPCPCRGARASAHRGGSDAPR